jgi:uncharacterized protein YnzC (UPF0291/DUF896 family)
LSTTYLSGTWRSVEEQVRKVVTVNELGNDGNNVIMRHKVFQSREEMGE